eukprot:COSAG02_NODE_8660_length_2488_cov_1.433654_1_plen_106_part_10
MGRGKEGNTAGPTEVDSHFCKIKRRCSCLSNFAQSAPQNSTILSCILLYLSERNKFPLRIDLLIEEPKHVAAREEGGGWHFQQPGRTAPRGGAERRSVGCVVGRLH